MVLPTPKERSVFSHQELVDDNPRRSSSSRALLISHLNLNTCALIDTAGNVLRCGLVPLSPIGRTSSLGSLGRPPPQPITSIRERGTNSPGMVDETSGRQASSAPALPLAAWPGTASRRQDETMAPPRLSTGAGGSAEDRRADRLYSVPPRPPLLPQVRSAALHTPG